MPAVSCELLTVTILNHSSTNVINSFTNYLSKFIEIYIILSRLWPIFNTPERCFTAGRLSVRLGFIGLGRMGGNMVARLLQDGHQIVAFDAKSAAVEQAVALGAQSAHSLSEVVAGLTPPRLIWVMLPHGEPTSQVVQQLAALVSSGDIIVDGGNSNYKDSQQYGALLQARGVHFLDVGTSHGIWGKSMGYGMMIGGNPAIVEQVRPVFETLAPGPDCGWGHVGPVGAGHYCKTIHNGIQYGILQALSEGFELMHRKAEFNLDLAQVGAIWQQGGVIRSFILELMIQELQENPTLAGIASWIDDNETGRWTLDEALDANIPTPVIALAVQWRYRSRLPEPFGDKLLAAYRNRVGGHETKRKSSERD
jgi:6-phosphogluconate dehydrogenase